MVEEIAKENKENNPGKWPISLEVFLSHGCGWKWHDRSHIAEERVVEPQHLHEPERLEQLIQFIR